MNKGLLVTLCAVGFGGIGGVIGYAIARKKYFDLADREVESIKAKQKEHDEHLLKLYGIDPEKNNVQPPKPSTATVTPNTVNPSADRLEREKAIRDGNAAIIDYSKITKNYSNNEGGSQSNKDIYIITPDEFDESDYNCQTLRFYMKDAMITDDDNNIFSNFTEFIGPMDLWYDYFRSCDAVYVRNDRVAIDYEILKEPNAWKDVASPAQKAASLNLSGDDEDDD